jgi:hypothetical protein
LNSNNHPKPNPTISPYQKQRSHTPSAANDLYEQDEKNTTTQCEWEKREDEHSIDIDIDIQPCEHTTLDEQRKKILHRGEQL